MVEETPVVADALPWHTMSIEEVKTALELPSNVKETGISEQEAARRLEKYGENKLTAKKKETLLQRIWHHLNNVLVFILAMVALISLISAFVIDKEINPRYTSFIQIGIIVGVIVINTIIGLIQEGSAAQAAEALGAMLSDSAIVTRDGKNTKVPAESLVPGDIVVVSLGDRIPADLRVIETTNMCSAEAALTGESVPIEKVTSVIELDGRTAKQIPLGDRKNMCFSATLVAEGACVGIVVATGDQTEIGTINKLVNEEEKTETAVNKQIGTISKWLAGFIMLVALITFLYEKFASNTAAIMAVNTALVCAVAMIPEGLEAIVTVTFAWSVSKMAKHNAIIRSLPAVETLGSVTVICSDKTGTLTTNVMSMTAFVTSNAHYKNDVHASVRQTKNLVRDDTFFGEKADVGKIIRRNEAKKNGATGAGEEDGVEASTVKVDTSDVTPVGQGGSADESFWRQALIGGVLCSKCTLGKDGTREGEIGNPTELSILRSAYWSGVDVNEVKAAFPIIAEVPFSSDYKFMATVHSSSPENDGPGMEDKDIIHVKGAPDRMVKLCNSQAVAGQLGKTEPINAAFWQEQIAILSSHGLRVLALLRGSIKKGDVKGGDALKPEFVLDREPWLTIVGLCAIVDPPRPECVVAIEEAHHASVRVAMITGDHKDTALAIGASLGLVDTEHPAAITGPELDAMSDDEIKKAVMTYNVFARASPANKIRIVKALQSQGEVASMTGDGVNDAPALKAANMGVAMGLEGTDVAREAAEMILADDNFATILSAVKEGRVVWDNLRKVLMINTPINNAQGLSVLFGIICGFQRGTAQNDKVILTAIQVLYCNLICAVTLGFVAAVEPAEDGIMDVPPRRVGKRLIGRFLFLRIALGTVVLVFVTVAASFWAEDILVKEFGLDRMNPECIDRVHSQASNTLTIGACFVTLSARFSFQNSIHPRVFMENQFVLLSVLLVTVLQLAITYIPGLNTIVFAMRPMKLFQWGIVLLGGVIVFVALELEKALRRYLKSQGADVDDAEYGVFDDGAPTPNADIRLPKGASHLQLYANKH
uniref:Cation-transporting P-type ATPase N-terminal domain-containing protein n=1 Tax=Pseudo-nitzschia australis TaxID=44445 RepID=A0A7S4A9M6_9STRA|mmetsp:Transcript_26951/g.59216  ORF Transcript_26951/g.59216 Transcript_26951/m.59216 type:complete len:1052 (+) Transcript_26951:116-3271(+)